MTVKVIEPLIVMELTEDQVEEIGIQYIKRCYETLLELTNGCEITEEYKIQFALLEGMLAYVLTETERAEYYSSLINFKGYKQINLNFEWSVH